MKKLDRIFHIAAMVATVGMLVLAFTQALRGNIQLSGYFLLWFVAAGVVKLSYPKS